MKFSLCISGCLFILFFGTGVSLTGQSCATTGLTSIENRLAQNQALYTNQAGVRAVQYVPIALHAVRNTDGNDGISEAQLLDMMCILNDKYQDQEIQFYLTNPPVHYINNTGINNAPNQFTSELRAARIPNAINVFVTNNINNQLGAAGYYQSPAGWDGNDFIVVARNFVYAQNVFPHEIGHFFSLLHPFHGWENNPWSESAWGNPVGVNAPSDPGIFPSPIANEFQNGSNCSTSGDRICDTPPDYLFALNPNQTGCANWTIPVRDPNNTVVDPQENNIMSYFGNCGNHAFTAGQKEAIRVDLMNAPERDYVRNSFTPNMTAINSVPTLLSPAEGSTVNSSESVSVSWFPVIEAQYYVVEVDLSPGFSSPFRKSLVGAASTPNAVFTGLQQNTEYFWRVRPFTEYTTCTGYSDRGSFRTPTSTRVADLSEISDWSIAPNPVKRAEPIQLLLTSNTSFTAGIDIYNQLGQRVHHLSKSLISGAQSIYLETDGLTNGVYFVSISGESGRTTKRLLVQ